MPLADISGDAYVAGGAAVLGALAGGLASGIGTYLVEGRRQRFEERRQAQVRQRELEAEQAVLRGVAQVFADDFRRFFALTVIARKFKQWWPVGEEYDLRRDISAEDRKLLARHMSDNDWNTVMIGESALLLLKAVRADRPENDFAEDSLALVEANAKDIEAVRIVLVQLAEQLDAARSKPTD